MAYTSGGLIQATDYNGLANTSVANVWYVLSTGSGTYGYGQDAASISTVSAAGTITATQWAGLVHSVNKVLGHQGGAAAQLATGSNIGITAGATITAFANVSTAVTTIGTNRLSFNSTRGTLVTGANFDATFATSTFTQTITVTFASANQARYFFNAGGRFSLVFSPTSLGDNNKEISYQDLMNAIGTLHLDAETSTRTGTGETLTINGLAIGYWDLTTSNQTIIKLTSDNATYTGNTLEVFMRVAGAAGTNAPGAASAGTGGTYTDGADEAFDDAVSGTFRHRVDITPPETTFLANSWGVFGVA